MNVGICKVKLRIPENQSLKGKRHVIKSLIERVKARFNVSIAEVDDQDLWQLSTIGIVSVSNHNTHVNEVLSKVVNYISQNTYGAELLDYEIEVIPG